MVRLSSVQAVFRIIPRVLCEVPPQVPQPGISHTNPKSQFLFRRPRCNTAGLTFPPPAPLFAVGLGMILPLFILLSPSSPTIRKQGRLLARPSWSWTPCKGTATSDVQLQLGRTGTRNRNSNPSHWCGDAHEKKESVRCPRIRRPSRKSNNASLSELFPQTSSGLALTSCEC